MNAKNRHPWRLRFATLGASSALAAVIAAPTVAQDNDEGHTKTPIKHVVVIFPENRSFDHYFATYPNAMNKPVESQFHARDNTPGVNNLLAGL